MQAEHLQILVFTLQSIKSRIETSNPAKRMRIPDMFLLYSPLNQGLKLFKGDGDSMAPDSFYSTVH